MTYNVFSGTLNPTQSIKFTKIHTLVTCLNYSNTIYPSFVGFWCKSAPLSSHNYAGVIVECDKIIKEHSRV